MMVPHIGLWRSEIPIHFSGWIFDCLFSSRLIRLRLPEDLMVREMDFSLRRYSILIFFWWSTGRNVLFVLLFHMLRDKVEVGNQLDLIQLGGLERGVVQLAGWTVLSHRRTERWLELLGWCSDCKLI